MVIILTQTNGSSRATSLDNPAWSALIDTIALANG
jgi:hypothetical protein